MNVPIIKKDASIEISVSYNECGAIVNAIFSIANSWKPGQMDNLKKALQENKLDTITDSDSMTYLILDGLYRKILRKAQETNQTEDTELTIESPINSTPNP